MTRLNGFAAPAAMIALAALFVSPPAPAGAATVRFQTSAAGGIAVTGNTLGLSGNPTTGLPSDDHKIEVLIDSTATLQVTGWPMGTTRSWRDASSSAVLDLPEDATVLYAELVWAGSGGGQDDQGMSVSDLLGTAVTLTTPDGTFQISPDANTQLNPNTGGGYYSRSANVTSRITSGGTYTVGGVPVSLDGAQDAAGWTLLVVYEDATLPTRNLTLFSINELVSSSTSAETHITGLCTPQDAGALAGRLALTALEGDAPVDGDAFRFGPDSSGLTSVNARLSGPRNLIDNFFASQITDIDGDLDTRGSFGDANHSPGTNIVGGRQGWDIAGVDLSSKLTAGQTEAWIRGDSTGETYVMLAAALEIDLEAPRFANLDTALVATPDEPHPGDDVSVTVQLENVGGADATNVLFSLTEALPTNTSYVSGSFLVDGANPPGGAVTDGAALVSGVPLADIAVDESVVVTFTVHIDDILDGGLLSLRGAVDYGYTDCQSNPLTGEANTGRVTLLVTQCGDGIIAGSEICDDGGVDDEDGCDASCMVEYGWACDGPEGTPNHCTATCGDGQIAVGAETCDDGGTDAFDGCSASCAFEPGFDCVDPSPGPNGTPGSPDTECESECGDGKVALGVEECDDQNLDTLDGCDDGCMVEYAWDCAEDGAGLSTCTATCGDGQVAFGAEACDDGNTADLDGCAAACDAVEIGYSCQDDGPTVPGSVGSPDSRCDSTCGDGVIAVGAEICDDHNARSQDGCSSLCEVEYGWTCSAPLMTPSFCVPRCGDGKIAVGAELCDDGNAVGLDGCSGTCRDELGWSCTDPSPGQNGTVAAPDSACASTCGDGLIAVGGENCDDGDVATGDGCSDTCEVELGWYCDNATPASPSSCTISCGDGLVAAGVEPCDDGGTQASDGCSAICEVERGWTCPGGTGCATTCGDGLLAGGELCDDGNTDGGDGCAAGCDAYEPGYDCVDVIDDGDAVADTVCAATCGDGRLAVGAEACDDGGLEAGDGCSASCAFEPGWTCQGPAGSSTPCKAAECGDGIIAGAEVCDDGNADDNDGCTASCGAVESDWSCEDPEPEVLGTVAEPDSVCTTDCGDGVILGDEVCDDENTEEGDGCPSDCLSIDDGWTCDGEPSVCESICGDGMIAGAVEACDDQNTDDGDGCSSTCEVEPGWSCVTEPSICLPGCGDGLIRGNEQCDDGNHDPDDGCGANCTVEGGYVCEDEPSICIYDLDGDGIPDDGDNSGTIGDNPCVGGDTESCDDNCKGVVNSDQSDVDNDGIGDACDSPYDGPRVEGGGGGCAGGPASPLGLLAGLLFVVAVVARRRWA